MINVDPDVIPITHHLSLSDGSDTLGLILWGRRTVLRDGKSVEEPGPDPRAIKQSSYPRLSTQISQGRSGWSSTEMPFSPQVQEDWSGGRGNEDFDRDSTRFSDSYRCDTIRGDVICGPKATAATGINATFTTCARNSQIEIDDNAGTGSPFTATFTGKVREIRIRVSREIDSLGEGAAVKALVYADSSGSPTTTELASGYSGRRSGVFENIEFVIPIDLDVTIGAQYWVAFTAKSSDVLWIGTNDSRTGKNIYGVTTSWWTVAENQEVSYTIYELGRGEAVFFDYRGSLFAAMRPDNAAAPRLLMNGYRGMATSNATDRSTINTTLNLTGVNLAGKVVKIISGPGAEEEKNWRVIVSNTQGANAKLRVSPAWNVAHTTSTEYAIIGCDSWQEVAGHGLTKPVTSVLVVDDIIYFAQGLGTTMRRGRWSAGSWAWAEDTGQPDLLALVPDTGGKHKIWMTSNVSCKVHFAETVAWGTNLTWKNLEGNKPCGSTDARITGIEAYGTPLIPYILKEDSFGSISGTDGKYVYAEHPLSAQIRTVRSEDNGRARMRYDLFLKFSLLDGLESHYDQRLDDVGPNREEGLPANRRGPIIHLIPYAGRYYAAVDGGVTGYSSILCCTRDGSWHEIFRGLEGSRIRRLHIQVIPGSGVGRLWFNQEDEIFWMPLAIDPRKESTYAYFSGSQVVTSWIHCGFRDINKYFHELTLFCENLSAGHRYVTAEYQVDNQTSWTAIAGDFTTSPAQTVRMAENNKVKGRRIRLRLTLYTDNELITPRIKAYRLDAIVRLKPKKMWTITYMVRDLPKDLEGQEDIQTIVAGSSDPFPEYVLALLDKWADSEQEPCPLVMRHVRKIYDNKLVIVEPSSISPLSMITTPSGEAVFVGQFTLLEA